MTDSTDRVSGPRGPGMVRALVAALADPAPALRAALAGAEAVGHHEPALGFLDVDPFGIAAPGAPSADPGHASRSRRRAPTDRGRARRNRDLRQTVLPTSRSTAGVATSPPGSPTGVAAPAARAESSGPRPAAPVDGVRPTTSSAPGPDASVTATSRGPDGNGSPVAATGAVTGAATDVDGSVGESSADPASASAPPAEGFATLAAPLLNSLLARPDQGAAPRRSGTGGVATALGPPGPGVGGTPTRRRNPTGLGERWPATSPADRVEPATDIADRATGPGGPGGPGGWGGWGGSGGMGDPDDPGASPGPPAGLGHGFTLRRHGPHATHGRSASGAPSDPPVNGRAHRDPTATAARQSDLIDPEEVVALVAEVLAEQARRHGVDLS